jgi:hypothetical protein
MQTHTRHTTLWSTASFSDGDDTLPGNLNDLMAHLGNCRQPHGRMHFLRQAGRGTGMFLLGHLVTTAVVLLLLCGLLSMAF